MSNQSLSNNQSISSQHQNHHSSSSEEAKVNASVDSSASPKNQLSPKPKSYRERKRYKILAGNGCHQAIAEVQGILVPPADTESSFTLVLPDGLQIEATFKTPRLHWIAQNKDYMLGHHWFRGYPKMKDNKLVSLQIIAWDGNMPSNPKGEENWEFIGVWTAQKNITVQRSMMTKDIRKIAKETGFIKKFKYTFTNSYDWVKGRKLWVGYVYKLLCQRNGETLEIKRVIPYACPRIKPVPKTNNRKNYDKPMAKPYRK